MPEVEIAFTAASGVRLYGEDTIPAVRIRQYLN